MKGIVQHINEAGKEHVAVTSIDISKLDVGDTLVDKKGNPITHAVCLKRGYASRDGNLIKVVKLKPLSNDKVELAFDVESIKELGKLI